MKYQLVVFLFLLPLFSFAQKEIKGRVVDRKTLKPVPLATVTLHPIGSQNILAYTMTADDGTFFLKKDLMPDSVVISVRAMTIETQSRLVKSDVGFVEFRVTEKTTELKEVIVKAPKIRQTGDTLNYSVAGFVDATDRSIGDVLKKLPGIQVLPSGQILYQNKAISKFYVEGLDLLKGKYGIATNNIDASDVATVQVLENHQPVRVLKDMELPEAAAINLKLKESALGAFFASAQLGFGLPPALFSNELVGMRFTRTQQNMLVYKGDNTGRDITRELVSFYDAPETSDRELLSVQLPSAPQIKEQHFLFNDAHLISLNDLRTLKKEMTLTGNLSFIYDKQKSDSYSKRDIFLEDADTIHIAEDIDMKFLKRELEGSFTLEGNTEDYFLNNILNVSTKWNSRNSDVADIKPPLVSQYLNLPSFHIGNDFEYIHRKGNKRYRMGASFAYTYRNNFLRVVPSSFASLLTDNQVSDSSMLQKVVYDYLATKVYISGGIDKQRITAWYTAGVFYNRYHLRSRLYAGIPWMPIAADSVRNDFIRNEIGLKITPTFMFKISAKLNSQLSLPVTYLILDRSDEVRHKEQRKGNVLYAPFLSVECPFSPRISLFSNVSYANNLGGIEEDYRGYIMTTYRTMNRTGGLMSEERKLNAFVYLNYKNPFTTLFTSVRLSYSNLWRNRLRDIYYDGILSHTTSIRRSNTWHSYGINYSLGQSIDVLRSEVKLSTGYTVNRYIALNQGLISKVKSRLFSISPSVVTDIGKFAVIKYKISYNQSRNKIAAVRMPVIHYLAQDISASFIPMKKLVLNLSFNHYYNSLLESSDRSSWFGNIGLKYGFKRVDFMLDWNNIFNTRRFINYSYNDVSSYYSDYSFRSSEILFRVRFKVF